MLFILRRTPITTRTFTPFPYPMLVQSVIGESELHDRLDLLEAVFPRLCQPQRSPHLLGDRLAVDADGYEGEVVVRLGHGQALDIGPRIPELPLTGRFFRLLEEAQIGRAHVWNSSH